ncbi:MAG: DsbA family protein [Polyangiaceae bacterium]
MPGLRQGAPRLGKALREVPRPHPLRSSRTTRLQHPQARREGGARGPRGGARQGKFWRCIDRLFEMQPTPPDDTALEKVAKDLGLESKKFHDDLASEAIADEVGKDRKLGDQLDLQSTPLIFINGRHYDLDQFDFSEDLDDRIQLELELKTGQVPPRAVKDEPAKPPAVR